MKTVVIVSISVLVLVMVYFWKFSATVVNEGPLELKDARARSPISLPANAKKIYFSYISDFAFHQCFVRFEIPYEEGLAFSEELLKEHARAMNWKYKQPRVINISGERISLGLTISEKLKTDWFDIHNIKNGVMLGEAASWSPGIWIDKDRNLFYYCVTD